MADHIGGKSGGGGVARSADQREVHEPEQDGQQPQRQHVEDMPRVVEVARDQRPREQRLCIMFSINVSNAKPADSDQMGNVEGVEMSPAKEGQRSQRQSCVEE